MPTLLRLISVADYCRESTARTTRLQLLSGDIPPPPLSPTGRFTRGGGGGTVVDPEKCGGGMQIHPLSFFGTNYGPSLLCPCGLSGENFWLFLKKNQRLSCKGKLKRSLLLLPIRRLRFPLLSVENFWLLEIMFRWIFKGEEEECTMHLQLRREIWNELRTNFVQWPETGSLQRGKWK